MDYFDIIPTIKLPLSKPGTLTYSSGDLTDTFFRGQLVEMPLHGKKAKGIISDIHQKNPLKDRKIKILPVFKPALPFPIANKPQMQAISFASKKYYISEGVFYHQILPDLPKKIKSDIGPFSFDGSAPQPDRKPKSKLIRAYHDQRLENYLLEIKKVLSEGKQVLFLVPTLNSALKFYDIFSNEFNPEIISQISGLMADKAFFYEYLESLDGTSKIIIGTRQAAFTPMKNPGLIIIEEEDNASFKQWDMNPRFDARKISEFRAQNENIPIIYGSAAPSLDTRYYFSLKDSATIDLAGSENRTERIMLVDMKEEIQAGNFSLFSDVAREKISQNLQTGKQTLIFINRRASSSFVMCRDCGHIEKCGRCMVSMVEGSTMKLRCLHCGQIKEMPLSCQSCSSHRIKGFGAGVERILLESQKIWPRAKISIYDQDIVKKKTLLKDIYKKFDTGQIDILIGTQPVLAWKPFNLSLTVFLDIDSQLSFPDFRSHERTYSLISEALSGRDNDSLIIQSYNPLNPVLSLARTQEYGKFYKLELKNRKETGYPPFSRILKIISKDFSENLSFKMVDEVKKKLESVFQAKSGIKIIGPVKPPIARVRDKYIFQLIVMLPLDTGNIKTEKLDSILHNLSSKLIIDADPLMLN